MKSKWIFMLILVLNMLTGSQEKKYEETIDIKWWVAPFYAVDTSGKAIPELKPKDLKLKVNGKIVKDFIIYRKNIIETQLTRRKSHTQDGNINKSNRKLAFLIFDTIKTRSLMVKKSQALARKIIDQSPAGMEFVVLGMTRFRGLEYVCGPNQDKGYVKKSIKRKIRGWKKEEWLKRKIDIREEASRGGLRAAYDHFAEPEELQDYQKRIFGTKNFFISLQTLDSILKIFMGEGKVVYFFSTGIKLKMGNIVRDSLRLRSIADKFSKNGAVLFVINPEGVRGDEDKDFKGEESLNALAEASGGKYFEGTMKSITERVTELNRGYFEIGFPDPGRNIREFDVRLSSKNKNIIIHSIRKLSRGKTYLELNDTERSLLPVNMIEGGFWARSIYNISYKRLNSRRISQNHVCEISLPELFLNNEVDLFRIQVNPKTSDVRLARLRTIFRESNQTVKVRIIDGYRPYIVILNWIKKKSLVFIPQK